MPDTSVTELIPILQVAIGPVILISGVGLLLLTMTNRLARVMDRSRTLSRELPHTAGVEHNRALARLHLLRIRAHLIQLAITLASISILLAAILIIVLFLTALLKLDKAWIIITLFIGCMASLIGSLITFIYDINKSLTALKLEFGQTDEKKVKP